MLRQALRGLWHNAVHPLVTTACQAAFAFREAVLVGAWSTMLLLLLYALQGLAPAAGVFGLGGLLRTLSTIAGTRRGETTALIWLLELFCAWALGQGMANSLKSSFTAVLQARLQRKWDIMRLRRAATLPLITFERADEFDHLTRSVHPGETLRNVLDSVFELGQGVIGAISTALLFIVVSPWLSFGLVVTLVPQILQESRTNDAWNAFMYDKTPGQRRAEYFSELLVARRAQRELRLFGAHPMLTRLWTRLRIDLRRSRMQEQRRLAGQSLASYLISGIVSLGTALLLVRQLTYGAISAAEFIALLTGVAAFAQARVAILNGLGDLGIFASDLSYVREFVAHDQASSTPAHSGSPRRLQRAPRRPLQVGLSCEDVWFAYPGSDSPVLRGVTMHISPNECVALVGGNGTGKSTLVKLLLGLFRPDQGVVRLEGVDVSELDPRDVHRLVSAVLQDTSRLEFSLRDSILLGHPAGVPLRPATLDACLEASGVRAVATRLPLGLDTPIGHVLDGGQNLSGGEWQRVAIARALLRDPAILLLDEPSSALDPLMEASLYSQFVAMSNSTQGERGLLLISHRLGSARIASRIVVLEDGRITEEGTHGELLAKAGLYSRMWDEQSSWYH